MTQFPKENDRRIIASDKPKITPDENPENKDRQVLRLLNHNSN